MLCSPQESSGLFANVEMLIRSCIFWAEWEDLYRVQANIVKMWCSLSSDLNQTVDYMRIYLELENFSSFYWESSASSYWVTGDIWRQPLGWYLPWGKKQGRFWGWLASWGKQNSVWSALPHDVFGILYTWQVPIGVFWKLVLSVVILCKSINKVCLWRFCMCFS